MPIPLARARSVLMPGLWLASHKHMALSSFALGRYPHLHAAVKGGVFKTVGDLIELPANFVSNKKIYERHSEFAGREYPQGWGRGPGGAAAEPEPSPFGDGKVDTFKVVLNDNMRAIYEEIEHFARRHCG